MTGKFITFEGGEGTGKSTQLKLLAEWLRDRGIDCLESKEPGGTEIGADIRRLLVCGDKDKMDPVAETLLYYADRRIHLTRKIWPALEHGQWLLSDRYADSTTAYQFYGYNQKIGYETLEAMYRLVAGNFKPDLTFLLDIDPQIGLARSFAKAGTMSEKETRFESRELEFHNLLRRGFLEIARREPQRFVVLNADRTIEELHKEITAVISERFGLSNDRR